MRNASCARGGEPEGWVCGDECGVEEPYMGGRSELYLDYSPAAFHSNPVNSNCPPSITVVSYKTYSSFHSILSPAAFLYCGPANMGQIKYPNLPSSI